MSWSQSRSQSSSGYTSSLSQPVWPQGPGTAAPSEYWYILACQSIRSTTISSGPATQY